MWTTVVCRIVELDEWSLCSPSAKGTYMYWPVELGRYVLKPGWVTAIHGMEFISKGGVKISDIREMNPLVSSLVFSALEEVNLVFTLMVSSTVMVDMVFARFMFCTFYWR